MEWLLEPVESARWVHGLYSGVFAFLLMQWQSRRQALKRMEHANLLLRRILHGHEPCAGWLSEEQGGNGD